MGLHAPLSTGSMTPGRRPALAVRLGTASSLGFLILLSGCSDMGSFTRRQGMVGSLKSNVAQLESEKDKLSRELAEQKTENRRIENQLAEVEAQNGDLAARLDDARAVMSRQGLEESRSAVSSSDDTRGNRRKATPAKVQPKGRKTPFAQIPAERRDLDESDQSDDEDLLDSPRFRGKSNDFGPQSRLDDRSPWMPVARGSKSPLLPMR